MRACLIALAILVAARPAGATTVVARSDAELVGMSGRVVHARVVEVHAEPGSGRTIVTVARLRVLEDFTGDPSPELTVRELGGRLAGRVMHVEGAAHYAVGDELLVCLERTRDGHWRSVAMGYSRFAVEPPSRSGPVARRRLSRRADGLEVLGAAQADTGGRTLDEFRRMAAVVTGASSVRHADVSPPVTPGKAGALSPASPVSASFTLLSGGLRWSEADVQQPVRWFRNAATLPPVEIGDVDAAIALAAQAWTEPPSASIRLVSAGALAIGVDDPYCGDAHAGAGLVSFEDPTGEIPSGTLAVGGGCADTVGGTTVNGTAFDRFTHAFVVLNNAAALGASIRTERNLRRVIEHEVGHGIGLGHSSVATTNIMYPSCCAFDSPVPPALGSDDLAGVAFIYPPDVDQDSLPDDWEAQFGLDPLSGAGADGATGDPDGDGISNADELRAGTHPRGFHVRYFAEGAASAFFETAFGLANPDASASAHVLLTFAPVGGAQVRQAATVLPLTHRRIVANDTGLIPGAEFSTVLESDVMIAADRIMVWDRSGVRYGAHAESAVDGPAPEWFFAEGATHSGFALFYLLQNPNAFEVHVEVTYLRPAPAAPITRTYLVAALSRTTVWVNLEDARLASVDVSATLAVQGGYGIVAERAMYLDRDGVAFEAGHEGAGATALSAEWFFAEGKTGPWFDEYILLANPADQAVVADATFMTADGAVVTRAIDVPARSRVSVDVELVHPVLADAEVATTIRTRGGARLVAERALWWGGAYPAWHEAHDSLGTTTTAARWVCASGETGGPHAADTFVLVANTADVPRDVRVRLLPDAGSPVDATFTVGAQRRFNIDIRAAFANSLDQTYAVVVEALSGAPDLVVERAIYWSAAGVFRAGAGNACARIP